MSSEVSGLSHAVVEEAEHLRVQELVQSIEKSSSSRSSGTLLSTGTPSGNGTQGVLCVALREEAEGQDGRRDQAGWPGSVGAGGA